jgi:hypothetical protein
MPSASDSATTSQQEFDGSSIEAAVALAASGDAVDEPALYLRAVAANMQAGKKVNSIVTDTC